MAHFVILFLHPQLNYLIVSISFRHRLSDNFYLTLKKQNAKQLANWNDEYELKNATCRNTR